LNSATKDTLAKTLSYGTTLMGDNEADLSMPGNYKDALARFLKNINHIWMRDVYSAMRVSHLLGDFPRNHLSTDCALFFDRTDAERLAAESVPHIGDKNGHVATFFGRSESGVLPHLTSFAIEIADLLKKEILWLPWLHQMSQKTYRSLKINALLRGEIIKRSPDKILRLSGVEPRDYSKVMTYLLGSSLVITDTYHLSLIAWKMGIPAICVGSGARNSKHTLGDKKKEVFYHTYGAQSFYVFTENLLDRTSRRSEIKNLVELIEHGSSFTSSIHQKICNHSKQSEEELLNVMLSNL